MCKTTLRKDDRGEAAANTDPHGNQGNTKHDPADQSLTKTQAMEATTKERPRNTVFGFMNIEFDGANFSFASGVGHRPS